ncbi:DMT family transporter [Spongorhabdus nitratireducens]
MKVHATDFMLAIAGGALLAIMISFNSQLAGFSSPMTASWVAHGIGAVTALGLIAILGTVSKHRKKPVLTTAKAPRWAYLGGLPGAAAVAIAAITVNSPLGLSGSLALGLLGQILFSLATDKFGWFGLKKRPLTVHDFVVVGLIGAGSMLLIFAGDAA